MAKKSLDKGSAARAAVEEIRRRREEDRKRWQAQAERMSARGRAADLAALPRTQLAPATAASCAQPKAGAVLELRHGREGGRAVTYERKAVLCGKKGCNKLHGPYWYAFWSAGGRTRSLYIGKAFRTVTEKNADRLRSGEASA